MRVKFCSHNDTASLTINPAWLYIQKWYQLYGKNSDVVWLVPGLFLFDDADTTVNKIVSEKPDILGLSFYIWNQNVQFYIAAQVRQKLPNVIIVCGGPQLSVHQDREDQLDFFRQHPYIDYVVYGDGERPFQQIIDYHSGLVLDKELFVNIVENDAGQRKIYPYEMISDEQYLSESPFTSQEVHMHKVRDNLVSQGIPLNKQIWTMEFARGCMYNCSFCDWGQNLTKKVKRRKHDWKLDIDLFWRMNVALRESDANFGQWKEDIEAYDYAWSLYDPDRNFYFAPTNTPKLKKEITEYLLTRNSKFSHPVRTAISLQDISEATLKAIDRPAVPWESIVDMVSNLKKNITPEKFREIEIETIVGLPGQTVDSIVEAMVKYTEMGVPRTSNNKWFLLPNSPAADDSYRRLWGLQTKDIFWFSNTDNKYAVADLDTLYQELSDLSSNHHIYFTKYSGIVGNRTMTLLDLWTVQVLTKKWIQLLDNRRDLIDSQTPDQVRTILFRLKNSARNEAQYQLNQHTANIEKYGFVVWGSFNPKEGLLFNNI